jgi:hypothetical protein
MHMKRADHPVVMTKFCNGDGAKGMSQLEEKLSQPEYWEELISSSSA